LTKSNPFTLPVALVGCFGFLVLFCLATWVTLVLAGPRGGEHGICGEGNTNGGLWGNQPLELRKLYDGGNWEYRHEPVHGFPPYRTCRAYASTSEDGPMRLVVAKEYPGDDWYELGLIFVLSPLFVLGTVRLRESRRR
jgi:hypothetical protein